MTESIHVYADSGIGEYHLTYLNMLNESYIKIYRDLNEFKASPATNKHAVFHACFPYYPNAENAIDGVILQLVDQCKTISVLISEVHTPIVDFATRFQCHNIQYFVCGFINGINTHQWMDWFATTSGFYKINVDILEQLNPYDSKPKYFDILLGKPKPHRDQVYHFIKDNELDNQVIMTYLLDHRNKLIKDCKSIREYGTDGFILNEPNLILLNEEFKGTIARVKYHNYEMSLSQVVPLSLYNQTAYTVIAETNFENHYTFFTEKTVKPILAERLFIMLGGQYYLRNLRELGFKTFDGIIDESYDLEPNNIRRWTMAIEQMKYLFEQPQIEILNKVRPIAEHNKRIMLETKWAGIMCDKLKKIITE